MSDLISRKALIKENELSMHDNQHKESKISLNHLNEHQHFLNMISKQPTAYDVDKVVEEIEDLPHGEYKDDYGKGFSAGVKACIKSVKGGLEE
jgi:hypothetical protein